MKTLDQIFADATSIRTLLTNHIQKIVSFRTDLSNTSDTSEIAKEITKEDAVGAQKLHTLCLGILDKYQKLQLALDAVSSVPRTDNQPPCSVVKGRRKAMQKEVNKQLMAGDELKKITSAMALALEKTVLYNENHKDAVEGGGDAPQCLDVSVALPEIPK